MKNKFKLSIVTLSTAIIMSCNQQPTTTNNTDVSTTSTNVEANTSTTSKMSVEDLKKSISDLNESFMKFDADLSANLGKSNLDTLTPQLLEFKKGNLLKKETDNSSGAEQITEYYDNSYVYSNFMSADNYCFNSFEIGYKGKTIRSGMSKEEIKTVFGKPVFENAEVLVFAAADKPAGVNEKGKYDCYGALKLIFKDGKLITFMSEYKHSVM